LEENTLIHQKYVLDESKKIKEVLGGANVKTFVRYTLGG
jgi:translation elongation factor EF-Ts